jgi:pimeloyl-ACP methyl ester carboxylesterase
VLQIRCASCGSRDEIALRYGGARLFVRSSYAGYVLDLLLRRVRLVTRLRGRWLERPWNRIRVWEAGNGDPMFLIHGLGRSGRYFERLADRLEDRFRVVAADLTGFRSLATWVGGIAG